MWKPAPHSPTATKEQRLNQEWAILGLPEWLVWLIDILVFLSRGQGKIHGYLNWPPPKCGCLILACATAVSLLHDTVFVHQKASCKFGIFWHSERALASRACLVQEGTLRLARQVTGGMGSIGDMSREKLKRLTCTDRTILTFDCHAEGVSWIVHSDRNTAVQSFAGMQLDYIWLFFGWTDFQKKNGI